MKAAKITKDHEESADFEVFIQEKLVSNGLHIYKLLTRTFSHLKAISEFVEKTFSSGKQLHIYIYI